MTGWKPLGGFEKQGMSSVLTDQFLLSGENTLEDEAEQRDQLRGKWNKGDGSMGQGGRGQSDYIWAYFQNTLKVMPIEFTDIG